MPKPKKILTTTMVWLQNGDKIIDIGEFPRTLYQGVVKAAIALGDDRMEIQLEEGGHFVRPETQWVKVLR